MEYYDNWQVIKEQIIDWTSDNNLSEQDMIEMYEMIIEDLENDINTLKTDLILNKERELV